jgi:hypothetical protein
MQRTIWNSIKYIYLKTITGILNFTISGSSKDCRELDNGELCELLHVYTHFFIQIIFDSLKWN